MFDTADPTSDDIPRCTVCPLELHGVDYSRLTCTHCEDRMYRQLNDIATYWAKLPDSTHRYVGEREPGRSMSVHAGMPGNGQVINLTAGGADTPLGLLLAIEDDWRRVRGYPARERVGRPVAELPRVLTFLRNHLRWACGAHLNPRLLDGEPLLPDVEGLNEVLGPMVGTLKRTVDEEPPQRLVLSRCLAPFVAGFACDGQVRVGVSIEPRKCPKCGTPWEREKWLKWAQKANQFGAAA